MSEWRIIRNADTQETILAHAKWCASFWCKYRGLQFVMKLDDREGLLFVEKGESVVGAGIHMFFMFMSIGVVWLDKNGTVVDKKLAKPWRPYYGPKQPAMYYIEAATDILDRVQIGDRLTFDEVSR